MGVLDWKGDLNWVAPGVSQLLQGNVGGSIESAATGGGIGSGIYSHFFGDPASTTQNAFSTAETDNTNNQAALMQYYAGQQANAAAQYAPLQKMFQASYGTNGIQAPTAPTAAGSPLQSMYQGSK